MKQKMLLSDEKALYHLINTKAFLLFLLWFQKISLLAILFASFSVAHSMNLYF